MKTTTTSALVAAAALSSTSLAAISMNIVRNPQIPKLRTRNLSARATITESLGNNVTGGSYFAQVQVGTPPQTVMLALDTGSSDVWMLDSKADLCTDPSLQDQLGSGCDTVFDSSKSSTLKTVDAGGFQIQYADQSGAQGDYITDSFSVGGAKISALEMGLAFNSTLPTGLLGVGYDTNEASLSPYPSIIDTMVTQGLISTKAYSLYLDDLQASTGSIIFGGIDSDKYHGSLLEIPIVPNNINGTKVYTEFSVPLTSFSITGQSGNTSTLTKGAYNEPVILDSGTTLTYVPDSLAQLIYDQVNAVADQDSGNIYVDCGLRDKSPKTTFNYGFGSGSSAITIAVPVSELVFDLDGLFSTDGSSTPSNLPFKNVCALGIMPSSDGPSLLGDTFLRSAYVVYDLKNNLIALAQTNFNSTSSNIIEMKASQTSIPNVSGVAQSVAVTETASGALGLGGGHTTSAAGGKSSASSTGTSSSGGGASASSSKSAGTAVVPAFDGRGLAVLAVSGLCALFGAGLVLA